ncbi:MAG: prepilin-type N-terminal cleavage/methylation domain-containing protein [Planctomycetota bacterium]
MSRPRRRGGFTLVEAIGVIVVLSVMAMVTSTIVLSSADAYARTGDRRDELRRVDLALERLVRELREVDAFAVAQQTRYVTSDGDGVELSGSNLIFTDTDGLTARLCAGVDAFAITYHSGNGSSLDIAGGDDPATARTARLSITAGDTTLSSVVMLRRNGGE